jgi:hypothetical protein
VPLRRGGSESGASRRRPPLALAALIVLYLLLFTEGGRYKVTAAFENASELVPGNQVDVAGAQYMRRCPGANERGPTEDQLTQGGTIDCDPDQVPVGP